MFKKLLSIIALTMLIGSQALAQQASPSSAVTQTGSTGQAANICLTATSASTVQDTLTIPNPGSGNTVYITFLMMAIEATGTISAASPVPFTTTNISGTPSFTACQSALTIGQVCFGGNPSGGMAFNPPLKAIMATSPTIVGPAGITNGAQRITACWYVAP